MRPAFLHALHSGAGRLDFSKLALLNLCDCADCQIVSRLFALRKHVSLAFSCVSIACCMCYKFGAKCCARTAMFSFACGFTFRLLWICMRSARGSTLLGASLDRLRLVVLHVYASHQSTLAALASERALLLSGCQLC